MLMFGEGIVASIIDISVWNFSVERAHLFDQRAMTEHLTSTVRHVGVSLWPFLGIMFVASVVGQVATGGFLLSGKALLPKLSRWFSRSGFSPGPSSPWPRSH